jgi:CheY-like chemotaxis protein
MTMRRVLIVDDSALTLDITRETLVEAGLDVVTASSMGELEVQDLSNFDLILMDVQMPELYGDDVASALRHVRNTRAQIVLFSTLPDDELATRAAEAGLDGYIRKQDGMPALITRVKELLA